MKNTIVLVYPRIHFEDNYPCSWIPYSVLAVASALLEQDVNVIIFDENRIYDNTFEQIINNNADIFCIGFSIMTGGEQIRHALTLADIAKKILPTVVTVFGGPHVNVLPEETLRHPLVDIVLRGPGQTSFPLLIKALHQQAGFEDVPGLFMNIDGKCFQGSVNELTAQTLIPYKFGLIDVSNYIQCDATISEKTVNYISTQGCAYKCRFCYETSYQRKYGKLSCDTVVNDIENFVSKYGVDGIKFYDADWFIDSRRSEVLIDSFIHLGISWAASIHPKDILRAKNNAQPLLNKLAGSNCKRLLMGIESGNDRVLKEVVDKGVSKNEAFDVAKAIAYHGILGSYTFIVGFPGESSEEQNDTFQFIERLWSLSPRPETRVHIYTPYPGTPLYQEALKRGFISPSRLEDWSDFDYYKATTPWTDEALEARVKEFTSMIPKN